MHMIPRSLSNPASLKQKLLNFLLTFSSLMASVRVLVNTGFSQNHPGVSHVFLACQL